MEVMREHEKFLSSHYKRLDKLIITWLLWEVQWV